MSVGSFVIHSCINFAEIFGAQDTNINPCHKNMFCCSQVQVVHWIDSMHSDGVIVRQPMQLAVTCASFFYNFLPLRSRCCIFWSVMHLFYVLLKNVFPKTSVICTIPMSFKCVLAFAATYIFDQ